MTRLAALALTALTGCGHLTFDLKGHEQDHCRVKTGLIFVEGCAVPSGGECHIWLPAGYRPE